MPFVAALAARAIPSVLGGAIGGGEEEGGAPPQEAAGDSLFGGLLQNLMGMINPMK